jgi:hypothetical protein
VQRDEAEAALVARTCPHCARVFKRPAGQRAHVLACWKKNPLSEEEILALPRHKRQRLQQQQQAAAEAPAVAPALPRRQPSARRRQIQGAGGSGRVADKDGFTIPQDIDWSRHAVGDQVYLDGKFSCAQLVVSDTNAAVAATAEAATAGGVVSGEGAQGSSPAQATVSKPHYYRGLAIITAITPTHAFVVDPLATDSRLNRKRKFRVDFGRIVHFHKSDRNKQRERQSGRVTTRGHRVAVKFD